MGSQKGGFNLRSIAYGLGLLDAVLAVVSFAFGHELAGWVFAVASALTLLAASALPKNARKSIPSSQDVNTPSLTRLKPIMKLREEIHGLLERHDDNPVVSAMRLDTQAEVDAVAARAVDMLEARKNVVKLTEGYFKSRAAIGRLETQLAAATDEQTRKTLESSLSARRQELLVYEELETMTKRLDENLLEAESSLAELRSQIIRAAADSAHDHATEEVEPFQEMTQRLRRISRTMEESIETVRSSSWA